MDVEQAKSPSLDEFKRLVREEYAFLASFGFREVRPPNDRYQNPFEVHFEKEGWRLVVGGYSYGFSADVDVRSPDGRSAALSHLVPQGFWRLHRDSFARGQQGDIGYTALCLQSHGSQFLQGKWSSFEDLFQLQEAWRVANFEEWKRKERERTMERATEKAAADFKAERYTEAANELSLFEDILPPAQLKKLAIARKRIAESRGIS